MALTKWLRQRRIQAWRLYAHYEPLRRLMRTFEEGVAEAELERLLAEPIARARVATKKALLEANTSILQSKETILHRRVHPLCPRYDIL